VGYTSDFPIIQYADDTLMIMEASSQQLFALKALLNTFADFTGLKVNYAKSSIIPINVPPKKCNIWLLLSIARMESFLLLILACLLAIRSPRPKIASPWLLEWKGD
jgi:hypothetical protein